MRGTARHQAAKVSAKALNAFSVAIRGLEHAQGILASEEARLAAVMAEAKREATEVAAASQANQQAIVKLRDLFPQ